MEAIVQTETGECGLACLAMIAAAHGQRIGLFELRRRFPASLRGMNLLRLMHVAEQIQMQGRPLRLELEQLDRLSLPCILHWDLNHYVVLAKVKRDRLTVHDPAAGDRKSVV